MKTLVQEKIKATGVLNAGKKSRASTVGGAGFRSLTACEADK